MKNSDFFELFDTVFDENGTVRLCGRDVCKKLIAAADTAAPAQKGKFGDSKTGTMNIKALNALYRTLKTAEFMEEAQNLREILAEMTEKLKAKTPEELCGKCSEKILPEQMEVLTEQAYAVTEQVHTTLAAKPETPVEMLKALEKSLKDFLQSLNGFCGSMELILS